MTLGLEDLLTLPNNDLQHQRVGIYTDSQSLCRHLEKIASNDGVIRSSSRKLINKLADLIAHHPERITMHWIPGHQGYKHNESADHEANEGRRSIREYHMNVPKSLLMTEADNLIRREFMEYLRANIQPSKWSKEYPSRDHFITEPSRKLPARLHDMHLFNLQTGHTGLRAHHSRIAGDDFDNSCRMCGKEPETIQHIFAECLDLEELEPERRMLKDIFGLESITNIIGRNEEKANEVLMAMIRKLVTRRIWI